MKNTKGGGWEEGGDMIYNRSNASYALNVYHTGHVPREEMKRESGRATSARDTRFPIPEIASPTISFLRSFVRS